MPSLNRFAQARLKDVASGKQLLEQAAAKQAGAQHAAQQVFASQLAAEQQSQGAPQQRRRIKSAEFRREAAQALSARRASNAGRAALKKHQDNSSNAAKLIVKNNAAIKKRNELMKLYEEYPYLPSDSKHGLKIYNMHSTKDGLHDADKLKRLHRKLTVAVHPDKAMTIDFKGKSVDPRLLSSKLGSAYNELSNLSPSQLEAYHAYQGNATYDGWMSNVVIQDQRQQQQAQRQQQEQERSRAAQQAQARRRAAQTFVPRPPSGPRPHSAPRSRSSPANWGYYQHPGTNLFEDEEQPRYSVPRYRPPRSSTEKEWTPSKHWMP